MDLERLKRAAEAAGGGWLPASEAQAAIASDNIAIGELMLELIPLASAFSRPTLSGFCVGAVAQGLSGALYFGANLEFAAGPLSLTVHAEQSAVVNTIVREHAAPVRLAVSAAPCGYCRQFLLELASAGQLEILLAGRHSCRDQVTRLQMARPLLETVYLRLRKASADFHHYCAGACSGYHPRRHMPPSPERIDCRGTELSHHFSRGQRRGAL
jgi:cytidine deaminase